MRWASFGLGLGLLLLVACAAVLDRLFPPDLSRLRDASALVEDSQGGLLRAFTARDGAWRLRVGPEGVDPRYLAMLLAYEDKRFRTHPGVDPLAAVRAVLQWARAGEVVSGASTLTMQTARLLEPRPRTLLSKLVEVARALQLEHHFAKDEILAMYLTLAPYGGNLEGVRAAARFYLGKEPDHLTDAEAALLVALPQSPERLRPDRAPEAARQARDAVLQRMSAGGVLSAEAIVEAREQPVPTARQPAAVDAPHLAARLHAAAPQAGTIRTLLDGSLQRAVQALTGRRQAALEPGATIAVLVVENAGRKVRAYLGSSDFFDDRRFGQNDMVQAVRSPGSALKPFIYGMAFDDLIVHPETIMVDAPTRFGDYAPQNFDRLYRGEITAREALQLSLNIPAVALLDRLGPSRLAHVFAEAGTPLRLPPDSGPPGLPIALGGVGTTLQDLVTLYAGLADGGAVLPLALTESATPADAAPESATPEIATPEIATPVMTPAAAWYITRILKEMPPPPNLLPGQHSRAAHVIAYKTGTSYGFRDAWAIGYDPTYTVGVWVGRPDGTFSPGRLGRDAAAPILFEVFDLLPGGGEQLAKPAAPPQGVLEATNAELPLNLRRFQGGRMLTATVLAPDGPQIAFPADGTTVELPRRQGRFESLPMRASGGAMPLLWLVNGAPVPAPGFKRAAAWQPDGAGLARITVIDHQGRTASAEVWIK